MALRLDGRNYNTITGDKETPYFGKKGCFKFQNGNRFDRGTINVCTAGTENRRMWKEKMFLLVLRWQRLNCKYTQITLIYCWKQLETWKIQAQNRKQNKNTNKIVVQIFAWQTELPTSNIEISDVENISYNNPRNKSLQ